MQPIERWRPITGHTGYEVSDHGHIRSWRRPGGALRLADQPHLLRPSAGVRGRYLQVAFYCPASKRYVHELVAEAFIGPRPQGTEVAHWDGNGHNNHVSNLRYATPAQNAADKIRHGRTNRGERCGSAKLTEEQVAEIRRRYGPYRRYSKGLETQRSLAAEFGVDWRTIGTIVRRVNWRY